MNPIEFYQNHLNRVSRSFAFCISRLEGPLRVWVSLTYLVCRILDTIEDAKWKQSSAQLMSFSDFERFVQSRDSLGVEAWMENMPKDIPEAEKLLVMDAKNILSDLHNAPDEAKRSIQILLSEMSAGMRHFLARKKDGVLKLQALHEVNQYCFFVAGIVGETLSKLLAAYDRSVKIHPELVVDAHHFGLFLQKINLLKDQYGDEKEGRFLIPSRAQVLRSLKKNADGAMRFIEKIPLEQQGFRVFCLSSLFLGLRTMPILLKQHSEIDFKKISRPETETLFQLLGSVCDQPEVLEKLYQEMTAPLAEGVKTLPIEFTKTEVGTNWYQQLYRGPLRPEDFIQLEMA